MSSEELAMNAHAAIPDTTPSPRFRDSPARWQAVLDRDPAADGAFYYAVRTTGIYCRPTCPARRPKLANVTFFASTEAAEDAGFRPCLRCRPTEVSAQQAAVVEVQRLLESADSYTTLSELSRAVGFSPFHLQRFFKQATGLSPAGYAAAHRVRRLKAQLAGGATVTDATYEAGFGSSHAAFRTATSELGMSPGVYRNGGQGKLIAYAIADSPLGRMLVAATTTGVCAIKFGEDDALLAELEAEFPRASLADDPESVAPHVQAVLDHLAGRRLHLDLPLDVTESAFQQRVWAALRQIPYGETRTYRQIAEMIGAPGAARAVGRACALNPVALAVPCHRVLSSEGNLAGYRWGLERKKVVLQLEATHGSSSAGVS
jgi:AraC family transcriptional regulator, regulatory protein of adaptative response / methylated-DNA-[protein]-cysteine methyltransferase